MITVKGQFGSTILSGITFSTSSSMEEIQFIISCDSNTSQVAHTINNNKFNKNVVFNEITETLSVGNTFSIIFQSDSINDIILQEETFFGLKNVIVELLP